MAKLEMSSDELRTHLYTSLRGKGILDSLKSQLRNRLATELQNSFGAVSPQYSVEKQSPKAAGKAQTCAMSVQVANNIIAEHMKKAGFEYSLSVFLPEAGLNMDKLLTTEDILHFLRISPSSAFANSLQTSPTEHGFLVQLLEALMKSTAPTDATQSPQQTASKAVQSDLCAQEDVSTSPRGFRKTSVATQLQALENAYARKAEEETQKYQQSLEDRLSEYQRDIEARYKKQLETEVNLFRTKELVKARLEEREKYQSEALKEREEAQHKHQQRLDDLRRSELQLKERYCKKEQELEASIYSQRQILLAEMESLKLREAEMKRQAELDKKMVAMERERVRIGGEQLATRETTLQHAANERAQKHQSELESQLQAKERELMKWESEYQMDQGRLASSKSDHQVMITKLEEERRKTERLQQLLQEATDRHITLENQKGALQQQIDQMRDYQQLKQKVSELQQRVAVADRKLSEAKIEYKRRLSEQKQLLKQLQMKHAKPISELASLQDEIEQLQKQHHKEMLTLEHDNKHLGKQLAVQTEYSVQLQRQLDEQLLQLKSAQREVEDLHSLVQQMKPLTNSYSRQGTKLVSAPGTKKTDVKRSSYSPRKPGPSVTSRQVEASSLRQLHSTHPPSLPSLTSTILPHSVSPVPRRASPSSLLTFGLPSTSAPGAGSVANKPAALDLSSDTSGQFLAETRATFARLEKEAEELEKTYQSFHQKAEGIESPRLHEDEPLLPLHQATLADHESSSTTTTTTTTPDQGVSPTLPNSSMLLQPQGVATLPLQTLPASISSSSSTTTTNAASTTLTVTSVQPNFTRSLVSTSHPPSTLTTVVATAPPALTAATTPPLDVVAAAVSPSPSLTSGSEAKPAQSGSQQQRMSTEEISTKARQQLTLDDWWKKSPPPPSSVSSQQPSNTVVASSPPVESSKTASAAVDNGHNKSSHITEKPKIKLDDLWKASNTVSETHTVGGESNKATNSGVQDSQRSHSPPPVKVERPKLSLDDLWKNPSPSKHTTTATSAKPAVDLNKQLKGEREEKEKLRREQQLQEQERVRKELEELERQEKLKKVEPSSQQGRAELPEHDNGEKQQRTNSEVGQGASVEVTNEETEGGEDKKKSVGSDNDGIDPVMLKYMELVKEKREKQQKSEEAGSQFPSVKKDSSGEKDFGVPSLSQATDSFGGFSDNENEGNPFEDW